MKMRPLSTRTMPHEVVKHKKKVNEAAKLENDGK